MISKIFYRFDWLLFLAVMALVVLGMISVYTTSLVTGDFSLFYKQLWFLIISLILMFGFSVFDYRNIRENSSLLLVLYVICLILLAGLFFFAPEIRGVVSWYKIGSFSFDPIEPTKVLLILILAKYFSTRHVELYHTKHIAFSGIYALLPAALVFFQPDFGAVVIFLAIWLGILLVSGIKIKHFVGLCLIFVTLFTLGWNTCLKDYQKERITSFLFSSDDPLDTDWNKNQSQISIGSGGLLGKGIGNGTQSQYGFLPEPDTDFIFASITEETGFTGAIFLLGMFALFFWRTLKNGIRANSNFARLFSAGWAISIFAQMFINIGMNIGFLPVVGLALPFVSYGGSSLVFNFLCLGILQNIRKVES